MNSYIGVENIFRKKHPNIYNVDLGNNYMEGFLIAGVIVQLTLQMLFLTEGVSRIKWTIMPVN